VLKKVHQRPEGQFVVGRLILCWPKTLIRQIFQLLSVLCDEIQHDFSNLVMLLG
jgi:hypothetical protein